MRSIKIVKSCKLSLLYNEQRNLFSLKILEINVITIIVKKL